MIHHWDVLLASKGAGLTTQQGLPSIGRLLHVSLDVGHDNVPGDAQVSVSQSMVGLPDDLIDVRPTRPSTWLEGRQSEEVQDWARWQLYSPTGGAEVGTVTDAAPWTTTGGAGLPLGANVLARIGTPPSAADSDLDGPLGLFFSYVTDILKNGAGQFSGYDRFENEGFTTGTGDYSFFLYQVGNEYLPPWADAKRLLDDHLLFRPMTFPSYVEAPVWQETAELAYVARVVLSPVPADDPLAVQFDTLRKGLGLPPLLVPTFLLRQPVGLEYLRYAGHQTYGFPMARLLEFPFTDVVELDRGVLLYDAPTGKAALAFPIIDSTAKTFTIELYPIGLPAAPGRLQVGQAEAFPAGLRALCCTVAGVPTFFGLGADGHLFATTLGYPVVPGHPPVTANTVDLGPHADVSWFGLVGAARRHPVAPDQPIN